MIVELALGGLCCVVVPFALAALVALLLVMRRGAAMASDTFSSPALAPAPLPPGSPDVAGFGAESWSDTPTPGVPHAAPGMGYGAWPGGDAGPGYGAPAYAPPPAGGPSSWVGSALGLGVGYAAGRVLRPHHRHGHRPASAGGVLGAFFGGGSHGHKKKSFSHSKPSSFKKAGGAKKKW